MGINKKQTVEQSVYDLALERVRATFDRFDKVVVLFSGGKDSTACMQLALTVAREKGRLPLDVVTFDEECIPPETVEYLERVRQNPDIRFKWFCLPLKAGNACSRDSSDWFMWYEPDRDKWVRPLPEGAITELKGFRHGMTVPDCPELIFGPECGTVGLILGIRTQESLTRYQSIATKTGADCYTMKANAWQSKVYPIYDWDVEDVWLAPAIHGWDYNRVYDTMAACGLNSTIARCSPTFGEQTNRRLWSYKVCWPELWAKMVDRVPGAATAARYANTELYGMGGNELGKPDDMTWQDATLSVLEQIKGAARVDVARGIHGCLKDHANSLVRSNAPRVPMPDEEPHPVTGWSWKILYGIASAGGNKLNRQSQKAHAKAVKTRKANGLCASGAEFIAMKSKLKKEGKL